MLLCPVYQNKAGHLLAHLYEIGKIHREIHYALLIRSARTVNVEVVSPGLFFVCLFVCSLFFV